MRLSMNIGFVTNSSFMVHHFPAQVLSNPKVAAFIKAFEIANGYVGEDLLNRSMAGTVAITQTQKESVRNQLTILNEPNVETDDVVITYGDEYDSVARSLAELMQEAAEDLGISCYSDEYH
jgi:hypothetical protein